MSSLVKPTRRGFITGLISLGVTAPAIVRASSLMPVKNMVILSNGINTGFTLVPDGYNVGFNLSSRQHTAFYSRLKLYMDDLKANGLWDKLDTVHLYDA